MMHACAPKLRPDLNFGTQTFVNAVAMSPVRIDASAAATDTIDYAATDQNGLISTSTRMVSVERAPAPSIVPTDAASHATILASSWRIFATVSSRKRRW